MQQWPDAYIDQWMAKAKDYPTKALLHMLKQLYAEQATKLESHELQLEGNLWRHPSPTNDGTDNQ